MRDPTHDGYHHVLALLDSFTQDGPNGQHMCLVYKAMGEPIRRFQARFPQHRFPTPLMKRISKQLLLGLDYTNSCGLVHTGILSWLNYRDKNTNHCVTDISPRNVLTEIKETWIFSKYLDDVPSAQEVKKLGRQSPVPTTFMKPPKDYKNIDIRLADFGEARQESEQNTDQVQPEKLRAPEVLLQLKWDSKIDIWSVACIVRQRNHEHKLHSSV